MVTESRNSIRTGAAYTNNFFTGTTTTSVCNRFSDGCFYFVKIPNNGTLVSIGNLGVNVDADSS
jgi:hypothetical protein